MLIKTATSQIAHGARPAPKSTEPKSGQSKLDSFINGDLDAVLKDNPWIATTMLGSAAYLGGAAYPSTWLHEMGHAKAIEALYSNSRPMVEVFPFEGGVTRWVPSPLSPLGEKLGANSARALVAASGTLVDLGVATSSFGVGFALRKKHPIIGHALMGYGAFTAGNSLLYASSALSGDLAALSAKGNDFATIAVKGGLHPLASMAILASVLPLQYAAMKWIESAGDDKQG